MENRFKEILNRNFLFSLGLVLCLAVFLPGSEGLAQNNTWKQNAPTSNGVSDEESMVSNGGKAYDFDQLLREVNNEKEAVETSNMSEEEKTTRLKFLDNALSIANEGLTIRAAFEQSYLLLEDSISVNFPSIDFTSIRDAYIDQFDQ
jgi:hypothetical protein